MGEKVQKVELLAPAGNLEKLKYAIRYGADAVYLGGTEFGLRAFAGNFTDAEMAEAVDFAHSRGKRIYVTVNIIAHNEDLHGLKDYLLKLQNLGVDALIVADPGIVRIAREVVPDMELHLSTQASNTNWSAARFWYDQGIRRIILARELTLDEIREMTSKVPEMDFEVFAHGAMCMAYSGRCLLSNYLTGRDANKGECAQPCRWEYSIYEKNRPGEAFDILEDERGTYIFNSKDLNTLTILPQIIESGVRSLKIEGRMKSLHYVSTITKVYREAIDRYYSDPENYVLSPTAIEEANKPSHRPFFTGFFNHKPDASYDSQHRETSKYYRDYDFIGVVMDYFPDTNTALVEQRNAFFVGQNVELMNIKGDSQRFVIESIKNYETGEEVGQAIHAQQLVLINMPFDTCEGAILRREADE